MWAVSVFLLAYLNLISGKTTIPNHMGCYSTTFVNQYSSYYKINQSLTIEECAAACNHRLTRYMGLQVDESFSVNNFVYCGNDLAEVSLKLDNSNCSTCQDNTTLSCGGINSMSVYLLRETTPLALLLQTNRGVELLIDNVTTITVPYSSSSPHQHVDYVYTDGLIISVINTGLLRFTYNNTAHNYTEPIRLLKHEAEPSSFALNFIDKRIYYVCKGDNNLHEIDSYRNMSRVLSGLDYVPEHISVDPFNRILTFVKSQSPNDIITILFLPKYNRLAQPLHHLNVNKIIALTMDIQERHLYAIVNLIGDQSTYLVRFDYGVTNMEMLLNAPQFINATVLEVFRGHIVWLSNVNNRSTIFMCRLKPMCLSENITSYSSTQTVYDFTIYHPEKQTPGKKRLCAELTCSHGCYIFSLFTARCTCPPGMELDSDNSTCIYVMPSTNESITQTTSTTQATLTTRATTSTFRKKSSSDLAELSTAGITPPQFGANTWKNNDNLGPETKCHVSFNTICVVINSILLTGMGILVIQVYKKVSQRGYVSEQQLELIHSYDDSLGNVLLH